MSDTIKIAVDAMGGDGSPKKVIDGIIHNYSKEKDNFYKIFGDKEQIFPLINNKIDEQNFEVIHTQNHVKNTDTPLGLFISDSADASKAYGIYRFPVDITFIFCFFGRFI